MIKSWIQRNLILPGSSNKSIQILGLINFQNTKNTHIFQFIFNYVYNLNIKRALTNQYETGEYLLGEKEQGRQRTQTNNSPKIKKFKNDLTCNYRNTKCKRIIIDILIVSQRNKFSNVKGGIITGTNSQKGNEYQKL